LEKLNQQKINRVRNELRVLQELPRNNQNTKLRPETDWILKNTRESFVIVYYHKKGDFKK
jgi:hypothetical protein